ncbi:DUF4167 domain-containing protein [Paracoccus marcusii]|uniref:DUF4167 domain-containing protein n=1 Tax=Paracoccus marcusii TaxID=59779 RepID=UPI003266C582
MRSSKSRSRSKSNRQRTLGNITNRVFDSSGPEGKVRGTPQQIIEKYLTLARDAQLSHDRVAEQSFLQHAEHYTRMLGEANREMAERQGRPDDDGYQSNIGSHGYHQGGQSGGQNNGGQNSGDRNNGGQNGNQGQQGEGNQRRDHQQRDGGQQRDQQRDGGHQPRDGQRDHQTRDGQPRDNQGRDSQPRDNQNRDNQARDNQARDNQARDNQGRDSQRDNQPREQRPRSEPRQDPRPDLSEENAPQFLQQPSLPEVMPATEDDGGAAVRTPEAEAPAKPARTRVSRPRAPRAVSEDGTPAPTRSRRKPVAEAERPAPVRPEGDQD